jgi:murein DD-endopeptidase MepM/ murein hydrolase activator NlpD
MQEPLAERPFARSVRRIKGEVNLVRPAWPLTKYTTRRARLWLTARWSDDLLMCRTAAHLALLILVVLVVTLSAALSLPRSLASPWQTLRRAAAERDESTTPSLRRDDVSAQTSGGLSAAELSSPLLSASSLNEDSEILVRAVVPHTIIPERPRDELAHYIVQPGDTIFGIAAQFGLAPETIMWANGRFVEDNPDLLRVGQELIILPVDGVYHQAGGGDTLEAIAAAYKVEPSAIINYSLNHLDADNPQIAAGQWLVVPGGTKPYVPRTVVAYSGPIPGDASHGTGVFGWPTAGQITQGYWDRHRALDVGAWQGAPVLAADSGYVVAAGWDDSGYGRMVVIDHGNGFQTLYAHMQVYYVEVGDSVAKGEQIGEVGSTGNSSGPHLHFEVRQNGIQRNPFGFLP